MNPDEVTAPPAWVVTVAAEVFGQQATGAEALSGSGAGSQVFRVQLPDRSVVFKRYPAVEFGPARLVARLPGDVCADVLAESARHHVLCFEDLPGGSMAEELQSGDVGAAQRRALAGAYIRAVQRCHEALSALGRPAPVAHLRSPFDFAGFAALTPALAGHPSPSSHLDLLSGLTRAPEPPASVRSAARSADDDLSRFLASHRTRRRWILVDTNPSNLLSGPREAYRWVDLAPVPGLPDTNFLSLCGSAFRLTEEEARSVLGENGALPPEPDLVRVLNGLYSVFTLADTCLGLAEGTRDGLVHTAMDYGGAEDFSLALAVRLLDRPGAVAAGYVPYLEWLLSTPRRHRGPVGAGGREAR